MKTAHRHFKTDEEKRKKGQEDWLKIFDLFENLGKCFI